MVNVEAHAAHCRMASTILRIPGNPQAVVEPRKSGIMLPKCAVVERGATGSQPLPRPGSTFSRVFNFKRLRIIRATVATLFTLQAFYNAFCAPFDFATCVGRHNYSTTQEPNHTKQESKNGVLRVFVFCPYSTVQDISLNIKKQENRSRLNFLFENGCVLHKRSVQHIPIFLFSCKYQACLS